MSTEKRLVIHMNSNASMSRGKYAAQAVHAALLLVGAHPGTPVIVIGDKPRNIKNLEVVVHDHGRTEVEPGTMTAGAEWQWRDNGDGKPDAPFYCPDCDHPLGGYHEADGRGCTMPLNSAAMPLGRGEPWAKNCDCERKVHVDA